MAKDKNACALLSDLGFDKRSQRTFPRMEDNFTRGWIQPLSHLNERVLALVTSLKEYRKREPGLRPAHPSVLVHSLTRSSFASPRLSPLSLYERSDLNTTKSLPMLSDVPTQSECCRELILVTPHERMSLEIKIALHTGMIWNSRSTSFAAGNFIIESKSIVFLL